MYSFTICLLILVVGYFVYGRYVERVFGPEAKRPTPALTKADGVDYIPLPTWKIFMIQFLNIAGLDCLGECAGGGYARLFFGDVVDPAWR